MCNFEIMVSFWGVLCRVTARQHQHSMQEHAQSKNFTMHQGSLLKFNCISYYYVVVKYSKIYMYIHISIYIYIYTHIVRCFLFYAYVQCFTVPPFTFIQILKIFAGFDASVTRLFIKCLAQRCAESVCEHAVWLCHMRYGPRQVEQLSEICGS